MKKLFLLLSITSSLSICAQVDTTRGFEAPSDVTEDVQDLANYLTDGLSSDKEKANVLFNWVTHNISFDIKAAKDPEYDGKEAADVLKSKEGASSDYAELYKELCLNSGIDAVTIRGYLKDWKYDNGDDIYVPGYTWCAVKIDNRWELVDPTRGAGVITYTPGWLRKQLNKLTKEKIYYAKNPTFEYNYRPESFMIDPLIARFKILPIDPVWQLTEEAMPIAIFQQGDSAIMAYNQAHYYRVDNQPAMQKYVGMTAAERIVEIADRVHAFNERYDAILGSKDLVEAGTLADGYIKEGNINIASNMTIVAKNKLDSARAHYKEQEKAISPHYNLLKRKNSEKNRMASKRIREVKVQDRLLLSKYASAKSTVERKVSGIPEKVAKAEEEREEIRPGAINEVETITLEKQPGDPMLDAVGDSVDKKEKRAALKATYLEEEAVAINSWISENNRRLKDIVAQMKLADSFFIMEADARMRLKDDYDERVQKMAQQYNEYNTKAEELHLAYIAQFDSIVDRTERMQREYLGQMRLYKGILRHLEQYQRWYSREPNVKPEYAKVVKNYINTIDNYLQSQSYFKDYLNFNKEYIEGLEKDYESKGDIIKYMEEGEAKRKEMEEAELQEDKLYEEQKIAMALDAVDKMEKVLDDTLAELEQAESERLEEQLKRKEEMEKAREKEMKKKKKQE